MTHVDRKRKIDEDKEQADMCSPVKAQMKGDAATSQQEVKSLHVNAFNSARQAIEHASTLCQEILLATNERYYTGAQTGIESELVGALQSLQRSTISFQSRATLINIRAQNAPIYKVPSEIIFLVFGHLDTRELLASRAVCPLWRDVLASKAARDGVWKKALTKMIGTLSEVDASWRKLQEIDASPSSLDITIWKIEQLGGWVDLAYRLANSSLVKTFPSDSLCDLYVDIHHPMDRPMWKLVSQCSNLKVLHWAVDRDSEDWDDEEIQYSVLSTSPLASCGLEEFYFDVSPGVSIDLNFVRMLSQVKRLHLADGLEREHLVAILHAAGEHIDSLTIGELGSPFGWVGSEPEAKPSGPVLARLDSISIYDKGTGILSITAPNAKSILFNHGCLLDWTLLDSCRQSIKRLQIKSDTEKVDERLAHELFDMPRLEDMRVDFCWNAKKVGLAALWKAILAQATEKKEILLQDILPSLKRLEISQDDNLSPEVIFKFLKLRKALGLSPLEFLQIRFGIKYATTDLIVLDKLQNDMPGFSYRPY